MRWTITSLIVCAWAVVFVPIFFLSSGASAQAIENHVGGHDGIDILPAMPDGESPPPPPEPTFSLSVPLYTSRPQAPAHIYLDFLGDNTASWGRMDYKPLITPAYSIDTDTTTFTQTELNNIHEIWKRVSEAFSPFNVDVSTAPPPAQLLNRESVRVIIGGDGKNGQADYWVGKRAGGIAYPGSFSNSEPNSVYVFSGNLTDGDPKPTAMAIAHEVGHSFSLQHQRSFDASGTLLDEYNHGTAARAPLMGYSYLAERGVWENGPAATVGTYQDDVSYITASFNGFGYRADDYGNSAATAFGLGNVEQHLSASGVIERTNDADFFSFTISEESNAIFQLNPAEYGAMLDAALELWSFDGVSGTLLQRISTASLSETLGASLLPGLYDIAVRSAGQPGDLGQFFINATFSPIGGVPEPALMGLHTVIIALFNRSRRKPASQSSR